MAKQKQKLPLEFATKFKQEFGRVPNAYELWSFFEGRVSGIDELTK